ncbi:MAG: sigma-54-dependent transcriptional regulator [Gemmatimonadota bacterium]
MTRTAPRILVADDQADIREALRLLLKDEGFAIETAASPPAALDAIESNDFDAVLIDLNYARDTTSGREGLDLVGRIRTIDESLPIIVMTAWGSIDSAVEAMRRGARDYVEKPWDNERLLATVRNQVELHRALVETRRLESENRLLREGDDVPELIAGSRAMRPVLALIERIGPSDANVLIMGEPGTGKEVVARRLHARSNRAGRSFVPVNAGGLSEGVFESELFGHVKGAFTDAQTDRVGYFELADGGTLFLDEIGNMPLPQQARLLRVIESGELQPVGSSKTRRVDVRVISATNSDLAAAVAGDAFREDLLYRLNTVEIRLPPLRDRREDIAPLAEYFLGQRRRHYGKGPLEFAAGAMRALEGHTWPGNVRELQHAVERAVLLADGERVEEETLGLDRLPVRSPRLEQMTLDEAERLLVEKALSRHDGNVSRAAEALGLSRSAFYRRLKRHELET